MTLEVIPGKKEKDSKPHKCRSCLVLHRKLQVIYLLLVYFLNVYRRSVFPVMMLHVVSLNIFKRHTYTQLGNEQFWKCEGFFVELMQAHFPTTSTRKTECKQSQWCQMNFTCLSFFVKLKIRPSFCITLTSFMYVYLLLDLLF